MYLSGPDDVDNEVGYDGDVIYVEDGNETTTLIRRKRAVSLFRASRVLEK
jgi:hypothetical protein